MFIVGGGRRIIEEDRGKRIRREYRVLWKLRKGRVLSIVDLMWNKFYYFGILLGLDLEVLFYFVLFF